jgi:CubicO group peptidase (beta-lactamase class C family)
MMATLSIFLNDTLLFKPGARHSYSSDGFNLAGLAIERAAQQPYLKVIREQVLEPLHRRQTAPDGPDISRSSRAVPYDVDSVGHATVSVPDDLSDRWPSGGFLSSALDLARFGQAYATKGFRSDSYETRDDAAARRGRRLRCRIHLVGGCLHDRHHGGIDVCHHQVEDAVGEKAWQSDG